MQIYDKPSFISYNADMYRSISGLYVLQQSINHLGFFSATGKIETNLLGITFDAYIAESEILILPQLNDIFLLNGVTYTIETIPYKQKGVSSIAPFYKIRLKTKKVVLPA